VSDRECAQSGLTVTNNINIDEENGKRYKIDFNENQIITFFKGQHNLQDNLTVIYTDGSNCKRDESISVGSAYYIESEEMVYTMSLNKNASIFTAEACAIAKALVWIHEKGNNEDVLIFTDSLSVIRVLKNNCINVKEATNQIPNNLFKIPITDFRETFRNDMFNKTNELKKQFKFKGKRYYEKFCDESVRYSWFAGINLPRKFVTMFNRIRSNHYNLNESLARKEYNASPRCGCGHEVEDINHFVFACTTYDEI